MTPFFWELIFTMISLWRGSFWNFFLKISRTCRFIRFRSTAEPNSREITMAHRLWFSSFSDQRIVNGAHFHRAPEEKSCEISLFRFILRAFRKRYCGSFSNYSCTLPNRDYPIVRVSAGIDCRHSVRYFYCLECPAQQDGLWRWCG
jgi:hypothetical protein